MRERDIPNLSRVVEITIGDSLAIRPNFPRESSGARRLETESNRETQRLNISLTLTRHPPLSPPPPALCRARLSPSAVANFFYSFPIARARSSSANGNGDRTLEVISIKIFGRGSDEKRRWPATDRREGGGEGKESDCSILAQTGNNVIIIYGTRKQHNRQSRRTSSRREAGTSK